MRTFELYRESDASGISGTGKVGEGVIFVDGHTIFRWCVPHAANSIALYDSLGDFLSITVTAHSTNKSRIVFGDGEVREYGPAP